MKSFCILVLLIFCIIETSAQTIINERTYQLERPSSFMGKKINKTSDNGYIIVASITLRDTVGIFNDTLSEVLVKINKDFDLEWVIYKIIGKYMHSGLAFENRNKEYVYAGQFGYDGTTFLYVYKCNNKGEIIYELEKTKMIESNTQYGPIVLCKDESFAMISWWSKPTTNVIWMKKYDQEGNFLWKYFIDTIDRTLYSGMFLDAGKETSDKGFIIGGSFEKGKIEDVFLLKVDSLGRKIWKEIYLKGDRHYIKDVIEDSNGDFVMAGVYDSGSNWGSLFVRKTNNFGKEIWERIYRPTALTIPRQIIQTSDGGYVIAGQTFNRSASEYEDLFYHYLIKLNKDGEKEWERYWGKDTNNILEGVVETDNKNLVVVGAYNYSNLYVAEIENKSLINDGNEKVYEDELEIYPNIVPSSSEINISIKLSNPSKIQFFVYNTFGSLVECSLPFHFSSGVNFYSFSFKNLLSSGIYLLKVEIDGRKILAKPFSVIN